MGNLQAANATAADAAAAAAKAAAFKAKAAENAAAAKRGAGKPSLLHDRPRKDVDLGRQAATLLLGCELVAVAGPLQVAARAAVEADEADEVAVKVADWEAAGACDVAAFDLDAADPLAVDVAGE